MPFRAFAEHAYCLDLAYLDVPCVIAAGMLETEAGLVVIDPGPSTCLATLEQGLVDWGASWSDVHALLLTHIHLDHAGATGSIVAKAPHVCVFVHRRGASHLMRPRRLLQSAKRLYGDMMEPLWGAFLAVPEANIQVIAGGETLVFGTHRLNVVYTPGHAVHHVSYWDASSGTAFVGDTAGMRLPKTPYVSPVAPPPDITVEGWHQSLEAIEAWQPERLFVTHFGPHADVAWHLKDMRQRLDDWSAAARRAVATEDPQEDALQQFAQEQDADMRQHVAPAFHAQYEQFGNPAISWRGFARYWRKRLQQSQTS